MCICGSPREWEEPSGDSSDPPPGGETGVSSLCPEASSSSEHGVCSPWVDPVLLSGSSHGRNPRLAYSGVGLVRLSLSAPSARDRLYMCTGRSTLRAPRTSALQESILSQVQVAS